MIKQPPKCQSCGDTKRIMIPDEVGTYEECYWCMDKYNSAAIPQPPPKLNNSGPNIGDLVMADIKARMEFGYNKYGTYLKPNDGRDTLMDAYQEILDAAKYMRKMLFERDGK